MRRSVFVYNPRSGRQSSGRLLPLVLAELEAGGFDPRPAPTAGRGDATRLARQAAAEGVEVVFAMGGDGTMREVAAGLVGTGSALGILPAGTANVLSIAFGLPRDALAAARVLPECRPQEVDVGLAGGEPFLMMVSCGVDAAVVAGQNARLKRLLGKPGVILSSLGRILAYGYPELEVRSDGQIARAGFVAVLNIPYYGGPYLLAPGADYRDGRLDLVLFRGRGPVATTAFIFDILRGRLERRTDVAVTRVREVEIQGPPAVPVQVDGDLLAAALPLAVTVASERLRVLMP